MPIKFNVNTKMRFNGKEYSRVEDMPAEVRQAFEQAMVQAQQSGSLTGMRSSTKIVYNGQEFNSVAEMPAEIRQQYEKVMDIVDADHNGILDVLENNGDALPSGAWTNSTADSITPAAPLFPAQDDAPRRDRRLLIAGIFLVGLIVLGLIVVLLQSGSFFK